jgi:uncharacterized protein YyaL (SSP411 family)
MLYDNAQLLRLYAEAAVVYQEPRYAAAARDTAAWMLRELRTPAGTFMTALDADDAQGEGSFYTWTPQELVSVLGPERAEVFATAYQVTATGNFHQGSTVLRRRQGTPDDPGLAKDREALLAARDQRPRPSFDTLEVVAWNGLAIGALARAGRLLGDPDLTAAAVTAADHLLASRDPDGGLARTLSPGSPPGIVDDYAFLAEGLLDLHESTGAPRFLTAADDLASQALRRFQDPVTGTINLSERGRHDLIVALHRYEAEAEPSGAGRLLQVLERLHALGSETAEPSRSDAALRTAGSWLSKSPSRVPDFLAVLEGQQRKSLQVVLATTGPDDAPLAPFLQVYDSQVHPYGHRFIVTPKTTPKTIPLAAFPALANKLPTDQTTQAYVCWDGICKLPTSDPQVFLAQLAAGP